MPQSKPEEEDDHKIPLTGWDYMTRDVLELQSHPDYSAHARRVVDAVAKMTTKQLEELTIARGFISHGR